MNTHRFTHGRALWLPLSLAGMLALAGSQVLAASDTPAPSPLPGAAVPDSLTRGSPPDMAKPIPPGKAEKADSAFKKLDPTGKGYVAREDTRDLAGFETIFDKVDSKHTGRLDYSQFKKAWGQYATEKSPGAGKAAW